MDSEEWASSSERMRTVIGQLRQLSKDEFVAIDTETTGLRVEYPGEDRVIGLSVAFRNDEREMTSYYFPIAHETGRNLTVQDYRELKAVLELPHPYIFVNVQFDMIGLAFAGGLTEPGIDLTGHEFYDLPTMSMMIDENTPRRRGLDDLAKHYAKTEGKLVDKFVEKEKKTGNHNITPEQMFEYACVDAEQTLLTVEAMIHHKEWIYISEQTDLWERKQDFIAGPLINMRVRGVLTNMAVIEREIAEGEGIMADLEEEMQLKPSKHADMVEALINRLGLPVVKKSPKTGAPSFDKDAMELYDVMLEDLGDPLAKQVKTWRGWQKAITASYRPYKLLRGSDGRIRTTFNTHRTVTGRLSSSEPNLQQIPKEVEGKPWSVHVKDSFQARPGYVLLSADYSQLELRILAAYAQSAQLKEIFADGRDLFTEMSEQMGFPRKQVKGFVYANNYGAGDRKISAQLGIPLIMARRLRRAYQSSYPELRRFAEICTMKAEKDLRVHLWSDRYRHFKYRSEGYKAMNSVMQGGGADIVERVMVRVWNELDEPGVCEMLLQVHDALVFEVREDLAEDYSIKIKTIMEDIDTVTGGLFGDVVFNVEVEQWGE